MNLVVHSGFGVCFLDSVDCSAVKKDGMYIFELIDRCIEEIGVQNKANKDRDPLEKPVHDALEDEDNEWITGIEPTETDLEEGEVGASSQGVAAAPRGEETSKRGNQQKSKSRKRMRLIPTFEDEQSSPSSDDEEDNDIDMLTDSEAEATSY
jgi:hypothetical protein